jgi:Zn/Cd-binding protein ZinT
LAEIEKIKRKRKFAQLMKQGQKQSKFEIISNRILAFSHGKRGINWSGCEK